MEVPMMGKIPGKILGKYPAVKLPDELHAFILTNQCIVSIFIKKMERKISLKKLAFAFLGGAFATNIPAVLAGMEPKIERLDLKNIEMNERTLIFPFHKIEKVYFNDWENIIRIKIDGKKHSYIFNPDDYEEIKEKICGKS